MAKIRIYDLAKELEVSNKEILAIAGEKGIEAKTASSSIEESEAAVIRSAFGGKKASAAPKTETPKTETPKTETPKTEAPKAEAPKAEAPKAEAPKTEAPKTEAPRAEAQRPAGQPAQRPAGQQPQGGQGQGGQPPKKKRNISIVINNQDPRAQRQNQQRPQGGYRAPGQGGQRPVSRGPIKPLTPPSPTPSVQMVPDRTQPVRRPQENPAPAAQNPQTAPAANAPAANAPAAGAPAAPVRPESTAPQTRGTGAGQTGERRNAPSGTGAPRYRNDQQTRPQGQGRPAGGGRGYGDRTQGQPGTRPYRQGQEGQTGSARSGVGAGAGSRGFHNNPRGARPGSGPAAPFGGRAPQGGRGFAAPGAGQGPDKSRDQQRGKKVVERDKHKGKMFEEDAQSKRPGRFIKPEKKEEAPEEVIKVITLPETLTIKDLADKMKLRPADIVKKLFLAGKVVTVNQEISYEDAENIAMEYDILCEKEVKVNVIEEMLKEEEEDPDTLQERPPVVCVMGHVDHGKTSLLDAIRHTKVTDKESGGITQAIGAYTVAVNGKSITFLDTPGHEAFTAMRMRGANSTDIAILVVAADDGVMPQTIEAINHAKAAGVEIIVAVNKIDKPSANIDRVKQELSEYELVPEDWGGSTVFAPVSAKTGEGIENLLEMILLTADVMELRANPDRRARGLVIEAELDKGRGPVATVLVQKGTLRVGDFISAGASHGKVRAMIDDKGRRVKEAGPSTPVEILGLSDVPEAGEVFLAHDSDKEAKSYAETYFAENKEKKIAETQGRMSLEDLFSKIKEGNLKELNLIVKADVQGSVEAVKESLVKLSNDEVIVKCIHGGVGAINESDINLASASNAIIIGFNVRPDATAKERGEQENVDIRLYDVIYKAIEDIELVMKGMLDPVFEEKVIGHAEIRQIFKASAIGNIAGSYVLDGELRRGCKARIRRGDEVVFEGDLASLKRFKDDVKEVKSGFECGLVFDGFDKFEELDIVEAYIMVEVPR